MHHHSSWRCRDKEKDKDKNRKKDGDDDDEDDEEADVKMEDSAVEPEDGNPDDEDKKDSAAVREMQHTVEKKLTEHGRPLSVKDRHSQRV